PVDDRGAARQLLRPDAGDPLSGVRAADPAGAGPAHTRMTMDCSATCITISVMSTITIRTDDETDRALAELPRGGLSRSEAVREALLLAYHEARAAQLRAEAEEAASDPDDLAEVRAIREEMDAISAW